MFNNAMYKGRTVHPLICNSGCHRGESQPRNGSPEQGYSSEIVALVWSPNAGAYIPPIGYFPASRQNFWSLGVTRQTMLSTSGLEQVQDIVCLRDTITSLPTCIVVGWNRAKSRVQTRVQ
jgi:hypothetical protein